MKPHTDSRQAYLAAMGIQPWVRRDQAAGVPEVPDTALAEPAAAAPASAPVHTSSAPVTPPTAEMPATDNVAAGPPAHLVDIPPPAEEYVTESAPPPVEAGAQFAGPAVERILQMDWPQLKAAVRDCTACALHETRTQTVFGIGDEQADWMVVGEAPGAEEDRQGEPFVGRAGGLLNNMLRAIGLQREQVYIANTLKCRPPGNRDPRPEETARCEAYLRRQVQLVRPRVILAVGRVAAHNLLKVDTPLSRLRGQLHRYGDTPLVVTYHPAYLLRKPRDKARAWEDLKFALAASRGTP